MNAILTQSNLKLGFQSEIWENLEASMMLSGECSYTFGSCGTGLNLVKLWKWEVLREVSKEWVWDFIEVLTGYWPDWDVKVLLEWGLKFYWRTEWLVARLSCEGPPGRGLTFVFEKVIFFNREWERIKYMCGILTISFMCRKFVDSVLDCSWERNMVDHMDE